MNDLDCRAVTISPNIISVIPILISRFILNLRQAGDTSAPPSCSSQGASLVFRLQESIVGNIGEQLDDGFEVEEEAEELRGQIAGSETGDIIECPLEGEFASTTRA